MWTILTAPSRNNNAPWKLIFSLTTLAWTQHGDSLRIEVAGSSSRKQLRSSSGHAHDDDDDLEIILFTYLLNYKYKPLADTHTHREFCPELLQVNPVPKSKFLGTVVAELLQAVSPFRHPTNSIKALKDKTNIETIQYNINDLQCTIPQFY